MVGIDLGASDSFSLFSITSPISLFHFASPLSPTLCRAHSPLQSLNPLAQWPQQQSLVQILNLSPTLIDERPAMLTVVRRTIGEADGGATNDRRS
nr:hypothetical protein Iba_chr08bCG9120 [Ipomoea batatas]